MTPDVPDTIAERYEAIVDEYGDLVDSGDVGILDRELLVAYDALLTDWCPDPLVRGNAIRAQIRQAVRHD